MAEALGPIFDLFNTSQDKASIGFKTLSWGPPSTREIVISNWTISNDQLTTSLQSNHEYIGDVVTYNFPYPVTITPGNITLGYTVTGTLSPFPSGGYTFALNINGEEVAGSSNTDESISNSGTYPFTLTNTYTDVTSISFSFYGLNNSSGSTATLSFTSLTSTDIDIEGPIYDAFTNDQTNNSSQSHTNTSNWQYPSSRTVGSSSSSSSWEVSSNTLNSQISTVGAGGQFLSYSYDSPINISSGYIYLPYTITNGSLYSSPSEVVAGLNITSQGTTTSLNSINAYSSGTVLPSDQTLIFNLTQDYQDVTEITFLLSALSNESTTETPTLAFTSMSSSLAVTYYCLPAGSKVLTKQGYKPIETLQRGEETPQGKIANIIVQELRDNTLVKLAKIGDLLACANHSFLVQGKRVLAKDLPEAELMEGFAKDVLSDNKLYDIQYDFEGSYTVWTGEKELESQSRSPYCKCTSLSKELYWKEENYKDLLVDNTLQEY